MHGVQGERGEPEVSRDSDYPRPRVKVLTTAPNIAYSPNCCIIRAGGES